MSISYAQAFIDWRYLCEHYGTPKTQTDWQDIAYRLVYSPRKSTARNVIEELISDWFIDSENCVPNDVTVSIIAKRYGIYLAPNP